MRRNAIRDDSIAGASLGEQYLTIMVTCPDCHTKNTAGSVLCPECGARLDGVDFIDESWSAKPTIIRILVHIHHWTGVNLLGVLVLLIAAFALWGVTIIVDRVDSPLISMVALVVFLLIPAGVDILWRAFCGATPGAARYLMPFEGGAFLYLPVWLVIVVFPVAILTIVLLPLQE